MKEDNHTEPDHYQRFASLQPIHVIEHFGLDFHLGNVLKYILRAGKKDNSPYIEDLKKAQWYLKRAIERSH